MFDFDAQSVMDALSTARKLQASMSRAGLSTASKTGTWPFRVSSRVTMPTEIDHKWDR